MWHLVSSEMGPNMSSTQNLDDIMSHTHMCVSSPVNESFSTHRSIAAKFWVHDHFRAKAQGTWPIPCDAFRLEHFAQSLLQSRPPGVYLYLYLYWYVYIYIYIYIYTYIHTRVLVKCMCRCLFKCMYMYPHSHAFVLNILRNSSFNLSR